MPKPFYITTTLPYVNAEPHIGFATEIIRTDIIARWHKLSGDEVFFNTGTDDHGQKVYQKALEAGQEPQTYADDWAPKFWGLIKPLGISEDINFIRTTDVHHQKVAQEFWRRCDQNGFIYKKDYQVKYCVGCELEKTDSELVDGKCPLHPTYDLELRDEENYFFKFSEFQTKLLDFYEKNQSFVLPPERFHEIKKFVEKGLRDFSISRLASKMPWGVPVPNDSTQVMYVWFDALVNYISVIGWPDDEARFKKWWVESGGVVQYCGKDNLRQQSAMWQAMLMAVNLPNSQKIIVEGFITSGGQKMSKSVGNVVNPLEIVEKYGTDALRYFVARELPIFEDGDFTWERFKEAYNAGLANGLGNLVSRIMTLSEKYTESSSVAETIVNDKKVRGLSPFIKDALDSFNINLACQMIWNHISELDKIISDEEVFKVVKSDLSGARKMLENYLSKLAIIAFELESILPETSKKIIETMKLNKKPEQPLFARKD